MKNIIPILVVCCTASFTKTFCQNLVSIQTDRPDQTECPFIVPKKHFQIESGFNFEKINATERNFVYPTILWKYGVTQKFELRLISELNTLKTSGLPSKEITGISPIKIGFKHKIATEKGLFPTTSIIAHINLASFATSKLKTTYFAPEFRFTMQNTLSKKVNLGYNLGVEWSSETLEPTFIFTITTGISVTEKVGFYAELFGFSPKNEKTDHQFDCGVTYNIKPNLLLDLSTGKGITSRAPKHYVSIGFSARFPN